MIDPLGERLDVAVEHRGVGPDAEGVRDAVDLAPAVAVGLAGVAQLLGQARGEDLGAAARHRLEPGGLQTREGFRWLDLPASPEVVDLGGREGLDLHVGARRVQAGDDPFVVLEGPVRMVAADDVDLADLLADHADDVLDRVLEGAGFALLSREAAERAREHAHVGRRDVAIEDEIDAIALARGFHVIGHAPEAQEIVGLEEEQPVVAREAPPGLDLVPDSRQARVGKVQSLLPGKA